MWMLENHTPYQVERTWVRDKEGKHIWIVVVKATYDIGESGKPVLSEDPVPPLLAPVYHGEDGVSSLRYEADLVAMKPTTDVYLNATAFAPRGKPRDTVPVSIRVGDIRKTLLVSGERVWRRALTGGLAPSSPRSFVTMPIRYERAFGGSDQTALDPRDQRIDFRNPVGTGVSVQRSTLVGQPAPNVTYPGRKLGDGPPAGFGAIGSFWSPRKALAGTYDEKWKRERFPLLPDDYDPRSLLCAPVDQQARRYLRGDEPIELSNLTESGVLKFAIPRIYPVFTTHFGSRRKEHRGRLTSVVIEPDEDRLILVWQTALPVTSREVDYLDKTVIREKRSSR